MSSVQLFYQPAGMLRLTLDEKQTYLKVSVFQAAPLSRPGKYLSFIDGKGDEIVMVPTLEELTDDNRAIAQAELRRRYLTAQIQSITGIKQEFGVTYWHVITDRGERDFVVQSLSESCLWLSDTHLLIVDVDGNRFEIPNRAELDPLSKASLESVL